MTEQPKKSRSLFPLYILIVLFYMIVAFQVGEDYVLLESISHESDFEVNLNEGVNYKLWIDSPNGPDKINVTISRGSYTAFENTFVLTESGKSYTPHNPEFIVKENGTYHVHAKPLSSGTVYLEIEEYANPDSNN
ncbi:hypothetical protein EQO05_04840 [Methanosarcina sp. MSH10X1]|uniref:hypothetical protein n=1 Tax=Methanosarcina sp. MSH10X1 TaxID=2507075 RepID=UPI000FFB722D|nr:hypothetical protein [Methanosarcina sp. MSH10X1]RXA20463.1 hypothetical protein EQO05_04840 [Methanosarcina sp. MSH10X1]